MFVAATGLVPDKHLHNVKNWVATSLNPITYKKPPVPDIRTREQQAADRAILDDQRFKVCLGLLSSKDTLLPEYQELIQSGTLRFLTQSCIDLRNQANINAHELVNISDLRWSLNKAKVDNIVKNICSDSDLSGIEGAMKFVEFYQPKPHGSTGTGNVKTTMEFKIRDIIITTDTSI